MEVNLTTGMDLFLENFCRFLIKPPKCNKQRLGRVLRSCDKVHMCDRRSKCTGAGPRRSLVAVVVCGRGSLWYPLVEVQTLCLQNTGP